MMHAPFRNQRHATTHSSSSIPTPSASIAGMLNSPVRSTYTGSPFFALGRKKCGQCFLTMSNFGCGLLRTLSMSNSYERGREVVHAVRVQAPSDCWPLDDLSSPAAP